MIAVLAIHAAVVVVAALAGGRLRRRVFLVAALAPLAALAWILARAPGVAGGDPVVERQAWAPGLGLEVAFRVDGFALIMAGLIAGIGLLVVLYAYWYFSDRPGLGRFAANLVGFSGAMLGLVSADHLLLVFVFWEITSITSYLLIGFQDEEAAARSGALQALLVTSAGGLAMLAGMVVVAQAAGTYLLSEIVADPPGGAATAVGIGLILVGALSKSAQVPFHFWLPGAMTAPTPVSAYLHSATMVKAGVYLIARLAPAFAPVVGYWRPVVVGLGVASMLLGGWRALSQTDLKLLLAYGTVSQLGFMTVLVGAGVPALTSAGVLMIVAHALFKAPLFMAAGAVDHAAHTRDIRRLHRVAQSLPVVAAVAVTAGASMIGLPPLLGFVAKESAFAALAETAGPGVRTALAGVVIGSALTTAYTLRLLAGLWREAEPGVEPAEADHAVPGLAYPALLLAAAGLVLGTFPGLLDPIIGAGALSLTPLVEEVHLSLWHGFGLPLALSVVALGGGAALWASGALLAAATAVTARVPPAAAVYRASLAGINRLAKRVTAIVQNGSLPVYLGVVVATAVILPGSALVTGWRVPTDLVVAENPAQVVTVAVITVAALAAAMSVGRLSAVVFLGAVGYGVAVLFVIQGAPDLALTQILVETTSLAVFVLVLRHLPRRFEDRPWRLREVSRVVISVALGVFAAAFALVASAARRADPVSTGFLERALPEGGGRNVVNVILTDFRALDTLGEITVLLVAASGILSLVGAVRARRSVGE